MKFFLAIFSLTFLAGLMALWIWTSKNQLSFLDMGYAAYLFKSRAIEYYSEPGLAVFGDSLPVDTILPERMGPTVVNLAVSSSSPVEDYFLVERLMRRPARPQAVLLSFSPYHFYCIDGFWNNAVKDGMIGFSDILDMVMEAFRNKINFLSDQGLGSMDDRLSGILFSCGFPPGYVPSILASHFNGRLVENEEWLRIFTKTRGQYYIAPPDVPGSKDLNSSAKLKDFSVDPVIDLYFRKTLSLLDEEGVPVYFIFSPMNEYSIPAMRLNGSLSGYVDYIEGIARKDERFHILSKMKTIYSWRFFGDSSHLNGTGAELYTNDLIRVLNDAKVPGYPYGVLAR
jgi:hypothetical protein